jgi:hypothetical protein
VVSRSCGGRRGSGPNGDKKGSERDVNRDRGASVVCVRRWRRYATFFAWGAASPSGDLHPHDDKASESTGYGHDRFLTRDSLPISHRRTNQDGQRQDAQVARKVAHPGHAGEDEDDAASDEKHPDDEEDDGGFSPMFRCDSRA